MRGSPGGILLIGIGVFVLSLGWTGKFADVWNILKGGVPGLPGSDTDTDGDGPDKTYVCDADSDCPQGMRCIGRAGEGSHCLATEKPGPGDVCASGRQLVTVRSTMEKRCVIPADLAAMEGGKCRPGYVEVTRSTNQSSDLLCLRTTRQAGEASAVGISPARFMD